MGKVLTVEEVEALPSTVYVVQYSKDWFIDGSDERISGAGSLVNTSKDESDFNARLVSHSGGVWWHPIKAIKAGSEIFGSYGRDEDVDFPDASLMVEEEERPAKRVRFGNFIYSSLSLSLSLYSPLLFCFFLQLLVHCLIHPPSVSPFLLLINFRCASRTFHFVSRTFHCASRTFCY
jgi:hypothetical protein